MMSCSATSSKCNDCVFNQSKCTQYFLLHIIMFLRRILFLFAVNSNSVSINALIVLVYNELLKYLDQPANETVGVQNWN